MEARPLLTMLAIFETLNESALPRPHRVDLARQSRNRTCLRADRCLGRQPQSVSDLSATTRAGRRSRSAMIAAPPTGRRFEACAVLRDGRLGQDLSFGHTASASSVIHTPAEEPSGMSLS